MKLYRSPDHPDHWIGEDEHGVLMIWPARPRGWAKRKGYVGKRQLEAVKPAFARGTGWPGGGRGPTARSGPGGVTKPVGLRATTEERDAWKAAAGARKLSDWMRDTLNAAAREALAASPTARSRTKGKP
jgi:hypothetical protein